MQKPAPIALLNEFTANDITLACFAGPNPVGRFETPAQTSFHFRGVTLYPSPHRDVIGVQAPLGEQLLHVTVGKREAQVPADRKQPEEDYRVRTSATLDVGRETTLFL